LWLPSILVAHHPLHSSHDLIQASLDFAKPAFLGVPGGWPTWHSCTGPRSRHAAATSSSRARPFTGLGLSRRHHCACRAGYFAARSPRPYSTWRPVIGSGIASKSPATLRCFVAARNADRLSGFGFNAAKYTALAVLNYHDIGLRLPVSPGSTVTLLTSSALSLLGPSAGLLHVRPSLL
jgi:hypothetical protein